MTSSGGAGRRLPLTLTALFTPTGTSTSITFDTNLPAGGNMTVDNATVTNTPFNFGIQGDFFVL